MRRCRICRKDKKLQEFALTGHGDSVRRHECKDCMNRRGKAARTGWHGPSGSLRLPKGVEF